MINEVVAANELVAAGCKAEVQDELTLKGHYVLEKFSSREDGSPDFESGPYEVLEGYNLLINVGIQLMEDLLIGAGGTTYANANAYLGAGDSSAAVVATQTDLQASTNKTYKAMDVTFPSRASQTITWRSTFASGDANYAWEEVALFNGNNPPTAKMLSRIAQALGTKASGTSWQLTYTITIS